MDREAIQEHQIQFFDFFFRRGEYIDIGSVKGIVEKISIRSFQLRHHLGYLHTVPFGSLQKHPKGKTSDNSSIAMIFGILQVTNGRGLTKDRF